MRIPLGSRPGVALTLLAAASILTAVTPSSATTVAARSSQPVNSRPACPTSADQGVACQLRMVTDAAGRPLDLGNVSAASPPQGAYLAADLQDAYNLPSAWLGGRRTVAVVVPFDHPSAESDLTVYRESNELPPCTAAFPCFKKINQRGGEAPPSPNPAWSLHGSVGLDMASAACPNCSLLLVEADDASFANLGAAVDQAAAQRADAIVVMYSVGEHEGQAAQAAHFDHPGIPIVAAGPDGGFNPAGHQSLPAAYPSVIAVGGTELLRAPGTARGWKETAWAQSGSGCSVSEARPAWQPAGQCGARRTVADVSAVASAGTPVAISDTALGGGWVAVSGGPVAAAIIGGVYGLAGHDSTTPGSDLYAGQSQKYLNDITAGSNGFCGGSYLCTAGRGYDGPTGVGTPTGIGAF